MLFYKCQLLATHSVSKRCITINPCTADLITINPCTADLFASIFPSFEAGIAFAISSF